MNVPGFVDRQLAADAGTWPVTQEEIYIIFYKTEPAEVLARL